VSAPVLPSSADVVVVGAGLAGAAASLTAAEAGCTVALLEKCPEPGGSSVLAGGGLAFAETRLQAEAGVRDHALQLRADILAAGDHRNDPEAVEAYVSHQAETARWLEACGVEWSLHVTPSDKVSRMHATPQGYLVPFLLDRFRSVAGHGWVAGAAARRLRTDSGGRVVGVEVEHAGTLHTVTARRGVVLASGGFSRDPELLETFAPGWAHVVPMSGAGSTGDGLRMAWALGAGLRDMARVSASFGASVARFPDLSVQPGDRLRLLYPNAAGAIVVNQRGQRFVDESLSYKRISTVCEQQPDGVGIMVFDATVMERSRPVPAPADWRSGLEDGTVRQADTLAGLAGSLGIDPTALAGTVAGYNRHVARRHDPDFDRPMAGATPLDRPPFYAFPCRNGLTTTYCGLRVDARLRVLSVFGEPIDGLYAAGEVVGGFHGAGYLSGTALSMAAVFGRAAARNLVGTGDWPPPTQLRSGTRHGRWVEGEPRE